MIAIYPGSFDPITKGHLNIIERAAKMFDKLIVATLINSSKNSLFSMEERLELIYESTKHLSNVELDSFSGLLVDYAKKREANILIRGLRAVSDFEVEMQMALVNHKLNSTLDTVFLCSDSEFAYLSSSIVKEIASFGGDISDFVSEHVALAVKDKFLGGIQ